MSVLSLKRFITAVGYPVNIEVIEDFWYRDSYGIGWNTDGNLEDLEDGNGNTYSMEYESQGKDFEGYFVVNGNDGCGNTVTYLFNLDKEVSFE